MNQRSYHTVFFSLLLGVLSVDGIHSQTRLDRQEYIELFAQISMEEMRLYGIPASIKLAQALLESDNGNSLLAKKANNHFGVKCHTGWEGPAFFKDDDKKNECFRSYKTAEESYRDHSSFLKGRERYRALFSLPPDDFEGWAHGLKEAGYATNPRYAHLLIKIIRDNELHHYDRLVLRGMVSDQETPEGRIRKNRKDKGEDFGAISLEKRRESFEVNGTRYVLSGSGDTYSSLAREFDLAEWMIRRFNERGKGIEPHTGDRVFIQPKKKNHKQGMHLVKSGETLRDISARYGVRMKQLKKYNEVTEDLLPAPGSKIFLSKKALKDQSKR